MKDIQDKRGWGQIVAFRGRRRGRRKGRSRSERERWKGRGRGRERGEEGGGGVRDHQLLEVLLAFICLEFDHMGAFLKSALSIDVKNNLKRSTLVTSKSDTTSQRQMWPDGVG